MRHDLAALAGFILIGWIVLVSLAFRGSPLPALVPRRVRASWRHGRGRPSIPRHVRSMVLAADRRRCIYCHSREQLQLDHIIPWSAGGLSILWNLAVLCGPCNKIKSNYREGKDGWSSYRPWPGMRNAHTAAAILHTELRRRHSPLRWIRALTGIGL